MAKTKGRVSHLFQAALGRHPPLESNVLTTSEHAAIRLALTVTGVFLVTGLIWVLFSDVLLYRLLHDEVLIARFETAKGGTFVLVAALLLYLVTLRGAARLAEVWRLNSAVIESIADGVLILGEERTIVYANPAALHMLGCQSGDLQGMGAAEFARLFRISYPNGARMPPEQFASQRAFDESGVIRHAGVLHRLGGGAIAFVATTSRVRLWPHEDPRWVVTTVHDVTEVDRLERARDQFFAAAAHSLKTPVAIIKGNAHALLTAGIERRVAAATSLKRQCDRVDRLVDNLLVMARVRSKSLELHPMDLEINSLLETIAGEAPSAYPHEIHTEVESASVVHADRERLALVIRNLLQEASRLSPPGSPVTLRTSKEDQWVSVGIRYQPVPWHEYAREVYEQIDDLGISRSVVDTIVEAHGGSLHEDVTDSNVVIWIRLPSLPATVPGQAHEPR